MGVNCVVISVWSEKLFSKLESIKIAAWLSWIDFFEQLFSAHCWLHRLKIETIAQVDKENRCSFKWDHIVRFYKKNCRKYTKKATDIFHSFVFRTYSCLLKQTFEAWTFYLHPKNLRSFELYLFILSSFIYYDCRKRIETIKDKEVKGMDGITSFWNNLATENFLVLQHEIYCCHIERWPSQCEAALQLWVRKYHRSYSFPLFRSSAPVVQVV